MTAAQDELFAHARGYYVTKALLALWRLGLLQRAMDGETLTPETIAVEGYDRELLQAVLDYLAVRGYVQFEPSNGGYRLSERGIAASSYYGYLPMLVGAYEPVFAQLENVLAGSRVYGRDVRRSEQELALGVGALEEHLLGRLTALARKAQYTKVLDLGCGSGRMLSRVCKLSGQIRGIGVDWDAQACEEAKRTIGREGLNDRVTILRGDVASIDQLPRDVIDGVDLVIGMFVMHEVLRQRDRTGTVAMLRGIAGLLGSHGRLIMVEVSQLESRDVQDGLLFIPEYELVHNFSAQRLAAREVWEDMVGEAGMRVVEVGAAGMCQAFCLVAAGEGAPATSG
jgi:SAM-dependent methyltransferase